MPIQKFEDLVGIHEKLTQQFRTLQDCCAFTPLLEAKIKVFLDEKKYAPLQECLRQWVVANTERVAHEREKCQSLAPLTTDGYQQIHAKLKRLILHEEAAREEEAARKEAARQKVQDAAQDAVPQPLEQPFWLSSRPDHTGQRVYKPLCVRLPESCTGIPAGGGAPISLEGGVWVTVCGYPCVAEQEVMCIRLVEGLAVDLNKDIYIYQDQWPLLQRVLDAERREREAWRHASWQRDQVEAATREHGREGVEMAREHCLPVLHRLEFILTSGRRFYEDIVSLCTYSAPIELCRLFTAYYADSIAHLTVSSRQNNRIRSFFTSLRGQPTLEDFYERLKAFMKSDDFEHLSSVRRFLCCFQVPLIAPVMQERFKLLEKVLIDTFGVVASTLGVEARTLGSGTCTLGEGIELQMQAKWPKR